jgi:hypothetical protein
VRKGHFVRLQDSRKGCFARDLVKKALSRANKKTAMSIGIMGLRTENGDFLLTVIQNTVDSGQ